MDCVPINIGLLSNSTAAEGLGIMAHGQSMVAEPCE